MLELEVCDVSTYYGLHNIRTIKAIHAVSPEHAGLSLINLEILRVAELRPTIETESEIDLKLAVTR